MNPEIQKKILQFEAFINNVLRTDLAKFEEKLDSKNTDVAEFNQLKNVITTLQSTDLSKSEFKTQVDIGNNFYIQAQVQDASHILLDVGLGHYVEFTLAEALIVINVRIKLFEKQIAHIRKQIAKTNAHIKILKNESLMSDWRSIPCEDKHREFLEKFSAILIDFAFESVFRDNPVSRWRDASYLQEIINFDLLEEPKAQKDLLSAAKKILKYSVKTGHPYFMNQLFSGLDPYGLAGQWLTDVLNASVYTYEVAPVLTLMEKELTKKLLHMFYKNDNGFKTGDGLFSPGGSFANGTAINLARFSFRRRRKDSDDKTVKPILFASEDAHYSVLKWANVCDVKVVLVQTDELGRMSIDDLKIRIQEEQAKGNPVFMVLATAGTTVLGAFDPLIEIADICQDLNMWLHVDAAWGGGLIFSKKHCGLLRGIERADSILFNPHKLLAVPQQCSLFLTKHDDILTKAHSKGATYLFQKDKFYSTDLDPGDKYLQCGRRADVLKFWFMWQAKGSSGFEKHVDHLMSLSAFFKDEIERKDGFELVTQPCFINVCFWFIPLHLRDKHSICDYEKELSKVAPKLKGQMTKRGSLMIGYQPLRDKPNFFRFVVQNSGTDMRDINYVLEELENLGESL